MISMQMSVPADACRLFPPEVWENSNWVHVETRLNIASSGEPDGVRASRGSVKFTSVRLRSFIQQRLAQTFFSNYYYYHYDGV